MTKPSNFLNEFPRSYWLEAKPKSQFPPLIKDIEADVTIVGGGLAGITSAYLLAETGLKIALIDSNELMNGTSGYTTAKITAQHGLIYNELLSTIGKENTKLYYQANMEGLNFIRQTTEKLGIDCDLHEEDASIYATEEENEEKIKAEAAAYEEIGIPGNLSKTIPLDIEIKNALTMKNQATFHPVKYMNALIRILEKKNVRIYENTTAVKVDTGEQPTVITKDGPEIKSQYVLICSHFPFYEGKALYSSRMSPNRSYVLAAKTKKKFPGGMYISAETPNFSMRSTKINNEEVILFSGQGHKTGKEKVETEHFKELERLADETFGISSILFHWAAQDLITLDNIPYIGPLTPGNENVLVATGFRKWGVTNSYVAAKLFYDKILGHENHYEKVFTPSRFHADPSLKNFAKFNVDAVSEFAKGKLEKPEKDSISLTNDEGAVVTLDGERKGAYRDKNGELHIVDTTCTHAGCEVNWNKIERTWDCPCHGSRFSSTGEVLEGPAKKPLKKYN